MHGMGCARYSTGKAKRMERRLLLVDPLALKAGLLGSNPEGLFKLWA